MTMLQMGHSFTFTDCHHAVLNFLVANAKINFDKVTVMEVKQHNVLYCQDTTYAYDLHYYI